MIHANDVRLECAIGHIIPDVLFVALGRKLLIEIFVTHRVDAEKRKRIEELGVATIEFDFSQMDRVVTKDDLRLVFLSDSREPGHGRGEWIHHKDRQQVQAELDAEFSVKRDGMIEKLRQQWEHLRDQERRSRLEEYGRAEDARRAERQRREEEKRRREFLFPP